MEYNRLTVNETTHLEKEKQEKFKEIETEQIYRGDAELMLSAKANWLKTRGDYFAQTLYLDQAWRDLMDVVKLDPNFISAYISIASVYGIKGMLKEAITMLEYASQLSKETKNHSYSFGIYYSLGRAYMDAGNMERAINNFEECLKAYDSISQEKEEVRMATTAKELLMQLKNT